MKIQAILLISLIAFTYGVSIGSSGNYNVDFVLRANSGTSSNSDLFITVDYDSSIYTGAQGLWIACVNTNTSAYELTSTTAALKTFIYTDACASSTCDAISDTGRAYTTGTTNFEQSTSTYTWQGSGTAQSVSFNQDSVTSTKYMGVISNLTSAQVATFALPATDETTYYVCFGQFDVAVPTFTAGSTVVLNTGTFTQTNLTLANNAYFGTFGAIGVSVAAIAYALF